MKLRSLVLVFVLAAACAGGKKPVSTITAAPVVQKALYDRLGGVDAINAIVKDFVEQRVAKDTRINGRFATADIKHLEQMLTDQLCEATGGPCKYTGKTMREAHSGMGIGENELGAFIEDLHASLDSFHVAKAEQDELLRKLAAMQDDIVEKKS